MLTLLKQQEQYSAIICKIKFFTGKELFHAGVTSITSKTII